MDASGQVEGAADGTVGAVAEFERGVSLYAAGDLRGAAEKWKRVLSMLPGDERTGAYVAWVESRLAVADAAEEHDPHSETQERAAAAPDAVPNVSDVSDASDVIEVADAPELSDDQKTGRHRVPTPPRGHLASDEPKTNPRYWAPVRDLDAIGGARGDGFGDEPDDAAGVTLVEAAPASSVPAHPDEDLYEDFVVEETLPEATHAAAAEPAPVAAAVAVSIVVPVEGSIAGSVDASGAEEKHDGEYDDFEVLPAVPPSR